MAGMLDCGSSTAGGGSGSLSVMKPLALSSYRDDLTDKHSLVKQLERKRSVLCASSLDIFN